MGPNHLKCLRLWQVIVDTECNLSFAYLCSCRSWIPCLILGGYGKNFRTISKFEKPLEAENSHGRKTIELDLEAEFSSLTLDIIGLGVFNYDFGSVMKESPVIQAVYGTLFEAEHTSTFYIPYWKFPLARWIVPRQRKFQKDLKFIR